MIQKPRETSIFLFLPRVPLFFSYDRVVQMRNAYGPKATGGGTAYGKQEVGGASKVPLMVHRESMVLSIFMQNSKTTWGFHSKIWD